jgi:hypothetical protein
VDLKNPPAIVQEFERQRGSVGKKRWAGVPFAERSRLGKAAVHARWNRVRKERAESIGQKV